MSKILWAILIIGVVAIILLIISAYQRGLIFNCCESEGMLCKEWCNETESEEALKLFQNITWDEEIQEAKRLSENLTTCRNIDDCRNNFTLAGCKKLDCNICCCSPHICGCTMVYCGYLDVYYYWDYDLREWVLNETCIEDAVPLQAKGD